MYNNNNHETYFIFDKLKNAYIYSTESIAELRDFIKKRICFHGHASWTYIPKNKYFVTKELSMTLKPSYDYTWTTRSEHDVETDTWITHEICVQHIRPEYVIVDNHGRIFNYTEIINELIAYRNNAKITFGLGHTYAGPAVTKSSHTDKRRLWYGPKRHHKSRCHMIVNKAERVASCNNLNNTAYLDITDEINEELGVSVNMQMIKSAYNSMRSNRRMMASHVWEDGYTDQYYRYGKPECWKNHKKTKQWKPDKNTARQTARKDNLRAHIDREYTYDYDDVFLSAESA